MRIFEHFPEQTRCVLCGTNKDKPCVLVAVDGTENGNICEAKPVHVECLTDRPWQINLQEGFIYSWVPKEEELDDAS